MSFSYSLLRALLGIAIFSLACALTAATGEGDAVPSASLEARIAEGEKLYARLCGACHSLDHNRVGPKHKQIFGAKAGSVPDYRYSRALQNLDVIWDEDTLDQWLQNPPRFARGTSMGFSVRDAQDRALIIAYLKHESTRTKDDAEASTP